jgi:hypothetical protein
MDCKLVSVEIVAMLASIVLALSGITAGAASSLRGRVSSPIAFNPEPLPLGRVGGKLSLLRGSGR